jgi:acetyl esterase/lipase
VILTFEPLQAVLGLALPLIAACLVAPPTLAAEAPKLMDWPDLLGRPLPQGAQRIAYGPLPEQVGDLWLPAGAGPFPVVLIVHGGCWDSRIAKLTIMNYAAEDLRRRGFAVWNIEYRGVDQAGGGYPGTFQDVAAGADALAGLALKHPLDLRRLVALGHSAGGHLVLWLAARPNLPTDSVLRSPSPLAIPAVVSTGGLPDLETVAALGDASCGTERVRKLTGAATQARPDVYADTSPLTLPPGQARAVMLNGEFDALAPPSMGERDAARMSVRGGHVRQVTIADTGHVELIAPGTTAWARTVQAIEPLTTAR